MTVKSIGLNGAFNARQADGASAEKNGEKFRQHLAQSALHSNRHHTPKNSHNGGHVNGTSVNPGPVNFGGGVVGPVHGTSVNPNPVSSGGGW